MTLGTQEQAFIDRLRDAPGLRTLGVDAMRANGARLRRLAGDVPPIARIEDVTVPGSGTEVRVYSPVTSAEPRPTLIFAHGGGWVAGDPDEVDQPSAALAEASGWDVVSVRYRLAPEHPYPAAADDMHAVLAWAADRASVVAIAGESAGGALAVGAALGWKNTDAPLALLIGIYPALGSDTDLPSYASEAPYGMKPDDVAWFLENYLPDGVDRTGAIPLEAETLANLPPTFVLSAEHDVLIDEAHEFVRRAALDGVDVEHVTLPGTIHGFWGLAKIMDASATAVEIVAAKLRSVSAPEVHREA